MPNFLTLPLIVFSKVYLIKILLCCEIVFQKDYFTAQTIEIYFSNVRSANRNYPVQAFHVIFFLSPFAWKWYFTYVGRYETNIQTLDTQKSSINMPFIYQRKPFWTVYIILRTYQSPNLISSYFEVPMPHLVQVGALFRHHIQYQVYKGYQSSNQR